MNVADYFTGKQADRDSGLEADQKVIAAHGCYAMTATTALTAQNTLGVYDVHHTPPQFLKKQIDACIEDIGVDVVKTGKFFGLQLWKLASNIIKACLHLLMQSMLLPKASSDMMFKHLL